MGYLLGVDLGTTFTSAAVVDQGRAEVIPLGNRSSVIPSVVYLRDDGDLLIGEAATRRAMSDPSRVAREFKRRMGDSAPLLLGGSPMSPQSLMAHVLRWVVDRVTEQLGQAPEHVAVSHPANWGPYKLDLFEQTVRLADVSDATTITEPEAAAAYYASVAQMEPEQTVAVYDLGGGTFDAAIVRRTEVGFDILGSPEGIEHLGGIDIDEAVFEHVRSSLDGAIEELDPHDPMTVAAAARLRQECVDAKEALSGDVEVSIPVLLPNRQTQVTLTREQLEEMIRPVLGQTIDALHRCLRTAQVQPDEIDAVLLVGGSSRIPLVADLVSEELGRPVAVDAHPKHSIVLGTALAAEEAVTRSQGADPVRIDVVAPRPTPAPPSPPPTPPSSSPAPPASPPDPSMSPAPAAPSPAPAAPSPAPAAPSPAPDPSTSPAAGGDPVPEPTAPSGGRGDRTVRSPGPIPVDRDGAGEPPAGGMDDDPGRGGWFAQRPARFGVAAAVLLIAIIGAVTFLTGDDDDPVEPVAADEPEEDEPEADPPVEEEPDEDGADDPDGDLEEVAVAEPTDDPNYRCDGSLCIAIREAWVDDDGALTVGWDPVNFDPDVTDWHAHFYWDVYDAAQVGSNADARGVEQAPWELTADRPFIATDELALTNRPHDAQGLCATVGDRNHAVIYPQNSHCVALPDEGHLVPFCSDGLCVEMTDVQIQDDELWIDWEPDGFEPDVAGEHAHFYWDSYFTVQVGTNHADFDVEQAPWELTDQIPFVPSGELSLANRPADARGLCVTVADQDHAVIDPTNYHCLPVPEYP